MKENNIKKKIIGGRRFFKVGKLYETQACLNVQQDGFQEYNILSFLTESPLEKGTICVLLSMPRWLHNKHAGYFNKGYQIKILVNNSIKYMWLNESVSPKCYLKQLKNDAVWGR